MREVERVADRLRVVAPRLARAAERDGEEVLEPLRRSLQDLADLAAEVEGHLPHPVPRLPVHAAADQLLVLGGEALEAAGACDEPERSEHVTRVRRILADLRALL